MSDDLIVRLERTAAERKTATPLDEPGHYLNVVAKTSRSDGALMAEAAARIADLERKLAEARTDAEQAVALAYQRAVKAIGNSRERVIHSGQVFFVDGVREGHNRCEAAILALAPAEPLAEVERMRAALESIARNTCCDGCQEAALVARAALSAYEEAQK